MDIDWRTMLKVNDKVVLLALDENDEPGMVCYANILEIGTTEIQVHAFSTQFPEGSVDTVPFPVVFGRITDEVYEEALSLDTPGMHWFIDRMSGNPNWYITVTEEKWMIGYTGREFLQDLPSDLPTRH